LYGQQNIKDAREINSRIAVANEAFNKKEKYSFHRQIGCKFKEETCKVLHLEHTFLWYRKLDTYRK
jgi:hypothetical protein